MPYLTEDRKKILEENKQKAVQEGDWNYLFTLAIIHVFSKDPRYATIHLLNKACYQNAIYCPHLETVEQLLRDINVSIADRKAARQLAFDEFYRRVGAKYEDNKAKQNGDVYQDLIDTVFTEGGE